MLEPHASNDSVDLGGAAIASVLLVMQAGFGLLSVLGLLVFARITGSMATAGGQALFALLLPLAALAAAGGVAAGRPWARRSALALEIVLLAFALLRLLVSRGGTLALTPLLTTFILPGAVVALLLRESNRRTIAARPEPAG